MWKGIILPEGDSGLLFQTATEQLNQILYRGS